MSFIQSIFRKIPSQAGKTLKYTALDPHAKSYMVRESLELLKKARIIHRVFHSDGNGVPLGAEVNFSFFKLIFVDTGLLSALLGLKLTDMISGTDYTLIHSGAIAEQFAGQHLLYGGKPWAEPSLYYWNRQSTSSTAEVDYLIESDGTVVPIEVKAGKTGRLKSLQMFICEKKSRLALRFNSEPPSVHAAVTSIAGKIPEEFTLLSLPLYLVEHTRRITGAWFAGNGDRVERRS